MAPVELNLPLPARWPYSRVLNGVEPGHSLPESLEVVKRTVAPEAQHYFNRILKVTESELQKLLIHKVQNLFDPLADSHASEFQQGHALKEKPVAEGQHLSAYIVTVLSRILVDFSRFADLVLRWQLNPDKKRLKRPATAGQVTLDLPSGEQSFEWLGAHCQPILERLERQDQQNTELEAKYSKVLAELRERTRLFLRERSLFRQRLKMIRSHAIKVEDDELLRLLDHDVQFFDDVQDDSIEDLKEGYEKKLLHQELSFNKIIKEKDLSINVLKGKVEDLEEAAEELKERRSIDKIGPLQAKLEKAEKMIEEMEGELHSAQEESRRFRSEHTALLTQLDSLKDVLQQKLSELEAQTSELTFASQQKHHLQETVDQLQSDLASCQSQLAAERRRADDEQKKREMQELQLTRAKEERAARLQKQVPKDLVQHVLPDDRLERAQREVSQLKEELTQNQQLLSQVQSEVAQLRAAQAADEDAREEERLRQAKLKSSADAAEAEAKQRLLEVQQELASSRAQETRLAHRLQESQDRLRQTQDELKQLQEQQEMDKQMKSEADGQLDAEDLRKALEKLEAERSEGPKPDRAKSHEKPAIQHLVPSLCENVGSQEIREATSFLSDEKTMTDQSQQTDPGEQQLQQLQLEPSADSVAQELQQLRSEKARLEATVKALQEELRLATDGQLEDRQPEPKHSRVPTAAKDGEKSWSPCKHCDDPAALKDEMAGMFDYPRVLTMGGGWLSGVSKRHPKVKQQLGARQATAVTSPSPRGRSPDFEKHMPAELIATRMPSPSPCRSSSPTPMVPRTAKAKRSTVCRSPPRHEPCMECDHGRQQRTARAPAPAVPANLSQERDPAGHPLGIDDGSWSAQAAESDRHDSAKANLASIDMATAARMHQKAAEKPCGAVPHRNREGDTLRRTFSGHGSISENIPTSRVFPRPRSAALLPGFRGRGNVRRLRPCSATGL